MLAELSLPSVVAKYILDRDTDTTKKEEEKVKDEKEDPNLIKIEEKPYEHTDYDVISYCYFCNMEFGSPKTLQKHHTKNHISERIYSHRCTQCDEKFLTNYGLL